MQFDNMTLCSIPKQGHTPFTIVGKLLQSLAIYLRLKEYLSISVYKLSGGI